MNNLKITLTTLLFSATAFAMENCTDPTLSSSATAEELVEQNCEVIDQMRSCAEKPIDPDAAKKRIEYLLGKVEAGEPTKYWQSAKKIYPPYNQFYDLDQSPGQNPPKDILDWLSDAKYSGAEVDQAALKESIIKKYVEYAKEYDCTPVLKHGYTHISYPQKVKANSYQELQRQVDKPDIKAAKDEYFKNYNAKSSETLTTCNPARYSNSAWQDVAQIYPPCSGNVSGLFKDNVSDVSTLDQEIVGSETNEVSQCIQSALAKGAKIHHVSISSSASALNNTGEAAKKFCRKGFLALSQARAESARDKILPTIFLKAGQENYDYTSKIQMDFKGSNGDGTSGACPYTIVDGKEVLKEQYRTPKGKKELDAYKYINVHVTFEDSMKRIDTKKSYYAPFYSCKRIYFECAPK
ncbi:MAG: hypothetical protein ACLGG0_09705 [Bacteriovoracia bacterium]